ncbi:hypothetical protein [Mesorhizobium sangaii]|uniref:Uncharacterized protein n=1 Tax=Mesorhizobium sangaii TaxID=505389 RepID=A0A841PDW2_9HYPH|nr:hypothetical protein [Mesorhizobium sangaii]MBB6408089.1 hypothetical protein [Mesorhizobium sangaii]
MEQRHIFNIHSHNFAANYFFETSNFYNCALNAKYAPVFGEKLTGYFFNLRPSDDIRPPIALWRCAEMQGDACPASFAFAEAIELAGALLCR